jgi:drug/metabolite transporter (DMT)-like permease
MFTYIPPLVGVLLGALFLGEHLNWQAMAGRSPVMGGVLILSGIAVVNMKKLPFKKPARVKEKEPAGC